MTSQKETARELLATADEAPETLDVDEVLEHVAYRDPTIRTVALRALGAVANDDPERVIPHLEDLRTHLDDEFLASTTAATAVFGFVAEEHPDAVASAVPDLVDLLDQEPPLLRFRAAMALKSLLLEHRDAFVPQADQLVDVLVDGPRVDIPDPDGPEIPEDQREDVRELIESREKEFNQDAARSKGVFEFAANAVVEIAEEDPDELLDRVDDIATMVDAEQPLVRAAVIDTLATLAETDPDAVAPAVDALRNQLDDEHEYIRAHAVRALGFAEATDAADDVRALAEDDDVDEDLRELAADTADWLDAQD